MKVKWTGEKPVDHLTGTWQPGEERVMDDEAALLLKKQIRGMELTKEEPVEPDVVEEAPGPVEEAPRPKGKKRSESK